MVKGDRADLPRTYGNGSRLGRAGAARRQVPPRGRAHAHARTAGRNRFGTGLRRRGGRRLVPRSPRGIRRRPCLALLDDAGTGNPSQVRHPVRLYGRDPAGVRPAPVRNARRDRSHCGRGRPGHCRAARGARRNGTTQPTPPGRQQLLVCARSRRSIRPGEHRTSPCRADPPDHRAGGPVRRRLRDVNAAVQARSKRELLSPASRHMGLRHRRSSLRYGADRGRVHPHHSGGGARSAPNAGAAGNVRPRAPPAPREPARTQHRLPRNSPRTR